MRDYVNKIRTWNNKWLIRNTIREYYRGIPKVWRRYRESGVSVSDIRERDRKEKNLKNRF